MFFFWTLTVKYHKEKQTLPVPLSKELDFFYCDCNSGPKCIFAMIFFKHVKYLKKFKLLRFLFSSLYMQYDANLNTEVEKSINVSVYFLIIQNLQDFVSIFDKFHTWCNMQARALIQIIWHFHCFFTSVPLFCYQKPFNISTLI